MKTKRQIELRLFERREEIKDLRRDIEDILEHSDTFLSVEDDADILWLEDRIGEILLEIKALRWVLSES